MAYFLENEFYKTLYQTFTLTSSLFILSCLIYFTLVYGLKVSTTRQKLRKRIIYLSGCAFIIFCAKIWMQGFTSIFYGISLLSAGLVVSNKESIMNLVGWGIISWRGLFSEGDFVEISDHRGIVVEMGILYIKLLEASSSISNRSTGQIIKIPNGLVINNIIKRYNIDNFIIEHQIQFLIPLLVDVDKIKLKVNSILEETTSRYYEKLPKLKGNKNDLKFIKSYIYQKPILTISFNLDKPDHYNITISYHTRVADKYAIEQKIIEQVLKETQANLHQPDTLKTDQTLKTQAEGALSY